MCLILEDRVSWMQFAVLLSVLNLPNYVIVSISETNPDCVPLGNAFVENQLMMHVLLQMQAFT